jgi:uncharacterized protein (TIGR02145 family)
MKTQINVTLVLLVALIWNYQVLSQTPCPGIPAITYQGQVYNTVKIGDQCWLKENLNVGTMIDSMQNMQDNDIIEKYCIHNEEDSCTRYGGLYQWNEVMQYSTTPGVQGICPANWHVPTEGEWTTLLTYVSSVPDFLCDSNTDYIAKALADSIYWHSSTEVCAPGNNLSENNATGFSWLPAGWRVFDGSFLEMGESSYQWTSSQLWGHSAYYLYLGRDYPEVVMSLDDLLHYGLNVRCVRD